MVFADSTSAPLQPPMLKSEFTVRTHLLLLSLLALLTGVIFLDEPKFGDDFTYWFHAFTLHERGFDGWAKNSFHQIRWPVWGICWVFQGILGPGLISYYAPPYIYLIGGSILSFLIGNRLFTKKAAGWACGIAFLFHPLIDSLVARPMPDIAEGIYGACAVLLWWQMMHTQSKRVIVLFAACAGLFMFVAEENRFTGFFLVPLLGCLTLAFFPRYWKRLLITYAVLGLLVAGQMLFYKWLFNDWLHFIHVNMGAKGRKGTESAAIWSLPFRFLDTMSKGGPIAPVYAACAVFGLWFAWVKHGLFGRVVVVWFVLMFLAYSCAPQQLWPYRPMLRDADRFLAGLAVPYGCIAICGLYGILSFLATRGFRILEKIGRRPVLTGCIAFIVLVGVSAAPIGDRGLFTLSYVNPFRAYMAALPDGTTVFTHTHMRGLAHLVDEKNARRIQWAGEKWILESKPELEKAAAASDEFWYIRKLAVLLQAKEITAGASKQHPLGSYFDTPERDWQLVQVLAKDDTPDIVMYRRRKPESPAPLIVGADAPLFKNLLPAMPYRWKQGDTQEIVFTEWTLPDALKGKLVRLEMEGSSDEREALRVQLTLFVNGKRQPPYLLKPNFHPKGGKEFVAMPIPANADKCELKIYFNKKADWIEITNVRLIAE